MWVRHVIQLYCLLLTNEGKISSVRVIGRDHRWGGRRSSSEHLPDEERVALI